MSTFTFILLIAVSGDYACRVWRVRDLTRRVERLEAEVRHVAG